MVDCQRGKASTPSLNRVLLRLKDIRRVTFAVGSSVWSIPCRPARRGKCVPEGVSGLGKARWCLLPTDWWPKQQRSESKDLKMEDPKKTPHWWQFSERKIWKMMRKQEKPLDIPWILMILGDCSTQFSDNPICGWWLTRYPNRPIDS